MALRSPLLAAGALLALAAPAPALAAWSAPVTVDSSQRSNPMALGVFGGSVALGTFAHTVTLARADGPGFAAPQTVADAGPYESVWGGGASAAGDLVVITVRRHKPTQRVRAIFVPAGGSATPSVTISGWKHSASSPVADVSPDGTVVAAWQWHDTAGWRVQAAIRRPGQARFDAPQLVSPAAPTQGRRQLRPWIHVAAGDGGRGVLTWQIGGDYRLPESSLHVLTAGDDSRFGADQELADAGGLADTGLAVSATGEVQVAYLDEHFSGHEAPSKLHVAQGAAGGPLSDARVISGGGQGTSSGPQVAAAFSQDGSATVAWAKPGANYEGGGTVEVFTRPAGGDFGAPQQVAQRAEGLAIAGGPGASAVLAWMSGDKPTAGALWSVHAATRPASGGPFAAEERISDPARNALWPSVATLPGGDALAAWVTNTDGSGGGQIAAARHAAG